MELENRFPRWVKNFFILRRIFRRKEIFRFTFVSIIFFNKRAEFPAKTKRFWVKKPKYAPVGFSEMG